MSYRIKEDRNRKERITEFNLENIDLDLDLEHSLLSTESWLYHENSNNVNLRIQDVKYIYRQKSNLQTKMKFMKSLDQEEKESYEELILKAKVKRIKWIREEFKENPNLSPGIIKELERLQNSDICSITGGFELYSNLVIEKNNQIPQLIDQYFIEYDKSIREGKTYDD